MRSIHDINLQASNLHLTCEIYHLAVEGRLSLTHGFI
jgi:hypothetical protein